MLKSRKFLASIFTSAIVAVGFAGPAAAQPVVTGGLVNVTIVDFITLQDVNVQIPIGIAANVCGNLQANVLARGDRQGPVSCEGATTQNLPVRWRPS